MSTIITSIVVAIAALIGLTSYYFSGPDNKVEQACEVVIQRETGENIDLSPEEPQAPTDAQISVTVEEGPTASDLADITSVNYKSQQAQS